MLVRYDEIDRFCGRIIVESDSGLQLKSSLDMTCGYIRSIEHHRRIAVDACYDEWIRANREVWRQVTLSRCDLGEDTGATDRQHA